MGRNGNMRPSCLSHLILQSTRLSTLRLCRASSFSFVGNLRHGTSSSSRQLTVCTFAPSRPRPGLVQICTLARPSICCQSASTLLCKPFPASRQKGEILLAEIIWLSLVLSIQSERSAEAIFGVGVGELVGEPLELVADRSYSFPATQCQVYNSTIELEIVADLEGSNAKYVSHNWQCWAQGGNFICNRKRCISTSVPTCPGAIN